MSIVGTALSALSPADMVKILAEYGPAIEALVRFIEKHGDDKTRALAMDSITRGLHYATQTGNTADLEAAIRSHCSPNGCQLP